MYAKFLAYSRPSKCYKGQTHMPKDWEKLLFMMDSTTITLFDNILRGRLSENYPNSHTNRCRVTWFAFL